MENEEYESVEETLRIMADVMNKEAMQFNIAPEFLQEVADEIANLKRQLAEKEAWGTSHIIDGGLVGNDGSEARNQK